MGAPAQKIIDSRNILLAFFSLMFQQVHGGECSAYATTFHLVEDKS
jgi:hypothetical protein